MENWWLPPPFRACSSSTYHLVVIVVLESNRGGGATMRSCGKQLDNNHSASFSSSSRLPHPLRVIPLTPGCRPPWRLFSNSGRWRRASGATGGSRRSPRGLTVSLCPPGFQCTIHWFVISSWTENRKCCLLPATSRSTSWLGGCCPCGPLGGACCWSFVLLSRRLIQIN